MISRSAMFVSRLWKGDMGTNVCCFGKLAEKFPYSRCVCCLTFAVVSLFESGDGFS